MSGAFRAELVRLRSRRFTWFVLAVMLLVCSGVAVQSWQEAKHPTAQDLAAAHAMYEQELASWQDHGLARCKDLEAKLSAADGVERDDCALMTPREEMYVLSPAAFVEDGRRADLAATALPVAIGALLLGASLVSAEFGAGSLGLWLTFVAPRSRVFRTKVAAAGVGGLAVAAVASLAAIGGSLLAFAVYGRLHGEVWSSLGLAGSTSGTILVVGALAGVAGAALGFALRHVAVVVGVVAWWVVAVEYVAPLVWQRAAPIGLLLNARAWVEGAAFYPVRTCTPSQYDPSGFDCSDVAHVIGWAQGGFVVLLAAVVVTAIGMLVFRMRDLA